MKTLDIANVPFNGGNRDGSTEQTAAILADPAFAQQLAQQYPLRPGRVVTLQSEHTHDNQAACSRLFMRVHDTMMQQMQALPHQPFLLIGGDHSIAMGTWSGVLDAAPDPDRVGLLWFDAHMDAHTFQTTPSGNLHGMPVAALLGADDPELRAFYPGCHHLNPDNLVLAGVRSYETEERELLDRMGVAWYGVDQMVHSDAGLAWIRSLWQRLRTQCDWIGISIDIDVIDPVDAPGVSTPVANGLPANTLYQLLHWLMQQPECIGLEIAEYSPANDAMSKTRQVLLDLIGHAFTKP